MSATRSYWPDLGRPEAGSRANRLLIPGWAVFAGANMWLMFALPGLETIPFHLVWFSLALVYGLAPWQLRTMVVALVVVTVATAVALGQHIAAGYIGLEEISEVPLMASIFLAMVWHVRRRQAALRQVERLAAAERDRAEGQEMFVRLMSHAMRTPITVARGFTELVRSAHEDPQTVEDTDIVLEELGKLDRGTQRLVTLMTADQPTLRERVDLDQVLERAARRWAPTARRHWQVDAAAGTVLADGDRLETVLDCLLENAVKFTADGDTITVHGRRDHGYAVIEVTDTGPGIPAGDLPHVFDTFHRGENGRLSEGTGLGLSIVRRSVTGWGGQVAARSTVGAGSTFTLRLPAPAGRAAVRDGLR
jgi:two-component system, OmpR family, sensor kinase